MEIKMHHLNLDTLVLDKGSHDRRDDGVCLLEAVAWWADEPHSDEPQCVSPVLAAFGRHLNDRLDDSRRQELLPLIPGLVGTRDDGLDEVRGYLALDWLIRTYTPMWLDLVGLTESAAQLRGLRCIVDPATAQAAPSVARSAQNKVAAIWKAAGAAVFTRADMDLWKVSRSVVQDAADCARSYSGAGARHVTWAISWDHAAAAAGAAAWATAGDAAWTAAWVVADDNGADDRPAWEDLLNARIAAGNALKPTIDALQILEIDLFRAMVRPTCKS